MYTCWMALIMPECIFESKICNIFLKLRIQFCSMCEIKITNKAWYATSKTRDEDNLTRTVLVQVTLRQYQSTLMFSFWLDSSCSCKVVCIDDQNTHTHSLHQKWALKANIYLIQWSKDICSILFCDPQI